MFQNETIFSFWNTMQRELKENVKKIFKSKWNMSKHPEQAVLIDPTQFWFTGHEWFWDFDFSPQSTTGKTVEMSHSRRKPSQLYPQGSLSAIELFTRLAPIGQIRIYLFHNQDNSPGQMRSSCTCCSSCTSKRCNSSSRSNGGSWSWPNTGVFSWELGDALVKM